jgi:hypothetical protein
MVGRQKFHHKTVRSEWNLLSMGVATLYRGSLTTSGRERPTDRTIIGVLIILIISYPDSLYLYS